MRARDEATNLVLGLRQGERPTARDELPTSNVCCYCDEFSRTYVELREPGVEIPQPPAQQSWGCWSMFKDREGNRFARPAGCCVVTGTGLDQRDD